jgi:hypothetical protein
MAFREEPPPKGIEVGSTIVVKIHLGIDPFFYFESLHKLPQMPGLIYGWKVKEILLDKTPYVEVAPKYLVRDKSKVQFDVIQGTDAWSDFDGLAEYVLLCEVEDEVPTYNLGPGI